MSSNLMKNHRIDCFMESLGNGEIQGHGASKGIGRAITKVLAKEGCSLHLASRTLADLNKIRDEINEEYGVQATIHALDLSKSVNTCKLIYGTDCTYKQFFVVLLIANRIIFSSKLNFTYFC